jgi:hypothetical protein
LGFLRLESLEERVLLAQLPWQPTSSNLADVQNGPMANAGQDLINIYQAYLSAGNTTNLASQFSQIKFGAGTVGVDINWNGSGDFNGYTNALTNLGMQVTTTSATYGIVEGFLPVAQLPTVAEEPQTLSLTPIYKPQTNFQGIANNEGNAALKADVASQQFGVNGSGVTIGVLSDSVNQAANPGGRPAGLAGSVQSGDLPAGSGPGGSAVNVIMDGPAGDTDEGRAMLENIHDIAPGASLAFATADVAGSLQYAQNIQALQSQAHANVIVDDIKFATEPMFQDGLIAQAVTSVTANGATYLAAVGNGANGGYLSQWRSTQATVGTLGAGTYMNFDPGSGVTTQLPITAAAGTELVMQFDQPYATEQPVGSPGKVTSQVNFYVLNAAGAVVAQSTSNNVATQAPFQLLTIPTGGTYTVVAKLISGPAPGHIEFSNTGQFTDLVSQQFGSAGGTFYPTAYGHETALATIGVGAVPWWAATPFLGANPLNSEPFSSNGPALLLFNPDGTPRTAQLVQAPVISGPDGGNTSFFPAPVNQNLLDTTNPPNPTVPATPLPTPAIPGNPATPTNLAQPNLPAFFGTSSAAPNVAAVVALMKQVNPSLSPAAIRSALITSGQTQPLNGSAPGTWDPKGGFGLVNATAALNAVNALRVLTATPTSGAATSLSPATVTLTFNRPVNFNTVSAADLTFTGLPAGVSIAVGAPIAVDNPQFPTVVAFPLSFTTAPSLVANGLYSYTLGGSIVAEDGSALIPFNGTFNLQATDGPRIVNTSINGRMLSIQFNEGVQPSSLSTLSVQLWRVNGASGFNQPGNLVVSNDPLATVTYNPLTDTATLNLTALPQSELPTDHYALIVMGTGPGSFVVDQAGLALDGAFNGIFPSGTGVPGSTFVQDLGVLTLAPPVVQAVKMDPSTDTGIPGDENTKDTTPIFDGQVMANFPGTVANLTILAEFSSLHGGNLDLAPGPNGRGFSGSFDVKTQTDVNGHFVIQAPSLFEGYQTVRVLVIGAPDIPPQAGLSSAFDHAFRVDNFSPQIGVPSSTPGVPLNAVTLTPGGTPLPLTGTNLASLSTLSLNVIDPMSPATGPLATPPQVLYPALDPATADNRGNYTLINTTTGVDESAFLTAAIFTPTDATFGAGTTPSRTATSDPFTGRIDLTFKPGLPAGTYALVVHSGPTGAASGLTDAAGNPLNNTAASGTADFTFSFSLQSTAVFITNLGLQNSYGQANSTLIGGPRSFFEMPAAGASPRAPAPPTAIVIDFSQPLDPNANYSNAVQLIASADGSGAAPDGNFGTLGQGGTGSGGSGFTVLNNVVPGTTVTLVDPSGKLPGDPGFSGTRLVLQLAPGTTLGPDNYRIYIPNSGSTAISDIFGHQLDGEFLGNLTPTGNNYVANATFDGYTSSPATAVGGYQPPIYQDLIANDMVNGVSQYRLNDLSGDGNPGGAFETGFTVVPNGNIIYARPDYVENPLDPTTYSDGSLAKPYEVLAPQATANSSNGGNLNAPSNFFNFNPANDLAGIGRFASSAFYAASQLSASGPVIIVALPATPQRDPVTGAVTTKTFVLQSLTDGSASVPFDTDLAFQPGAVLKLQNASLFVQNQGSALEALGNSNSHVIFTSLADSTAGGATSGTTGAPKGGDWGGIVFRNYDAVTNPATFPVDGTLVGPNSGVAVSGADEALSFLNFADVRYAGGSVPATNGIRYDAVTLYNSRPTLTNDTINIPDTTTAGAQAAISGDLDSFREDDLAKGPLIRQTTVANYSLNGIWVRPNLVTGLNGVAEATNAIAYPPNPSTLGGNVNYDFADPLPYILTSPLIIGEELEVGTGGLTTFVNNRLYVDPGVIVKSAGGASIDVVNNNASINIGSRTYMNEFDANPGFVVDPTKTGTQAEGLSDAPVLFTSLYDFDATTPLSPTKINSANDALLPSGETANQPSFTGSIGSNIVKLSDGTPDPIARWGSVGIQSGAVAVVNNATFQYGGGPVNGPTGSLPGQSVLAFITQNTRFATPLNSTTTGGGGRFRGGAGSLFDPLAQLGTHAIITNNNFYGNVDTPMQIEPNGLLAADPLRPLQSGDPFFHGNVLQRNDIDGMSIATESSLFLLTADETQVLRRVEQPSGNGSVNLTVNSVWTATDLTYVVRGTIILAGYYDNLTFVPGQGFTTSAPVPNTVAFAAEQLPSITLTIQSALGGTQLADGSFVPAPGQSVLVKMLNDYQPFGNGDTSTYGSNGATAATGASVDAGAGFIVGVDDGVDPPSTTGSPLVDPGAGSQIRILGIGGNATTGQQRVPAIITSLRDNTVGVTARGVQEFSIYNNDPLFNNNPTANAFFNPKAPPGPGDGGYIYIGGNSLTNMNLEDPRAGSLIDNADIRYMNSIQVQGGGIVDTNSTQTLPWPQVKLGQTPTTQFNSAMAMTISGSNLSNFSVAAVFVHPTAADSLVRDLSALTTPGAPLFPTRSTTVKGEGAVVYMYNDTISNSGVGVLANADTTGVTTLPSPIYVVLLNNTFYNNPIGVETNAPPFSPGTNPFTDSVTMLAMDNIFSNSTTAAIQATGQQFGSEAQYNLYWQNGSNLSLINTNPGFMGNLGAVLGDPKFVNAAGGNFQLMSTSAAIDAARSELGPDSAGDAVFPTVNQVLTAVGGIRTDPASLTPPATPGRSNANTGAAQITDPRKQVTLPGSPGATFADQWVAVLPTTPGAVPGPASNAATFAYMPITGERDQLGQLRADDPNVPNVGSGSRPFFDIGAFEFIQYFPPEVTAFSSSTNIPATLADGTTKDIYAVGSVAGVNQQVQSLQIKFNEQLQANTITNLSVLLVGSGGDGIFGNGNDVPFDLSGRLSYANTAAGSILTINMAGLNLPTDEYEITLEGTGANVIKNTKGNALDGQNTTNGDPNGTQLALPSGTGTPGSNFYLQFTVDTHAPSLVPGTFMLAPSSVTGSLPFVTNQTTPSFSGQITDIFPPANPLLGDTVFLDVFNQSTGQWVNVGQSTTNATGNFTVAVSTPLPNTPYNVGPDGLLGTPDDSGYDLARVRIVDQAGNASNAFTDPNSAFTAAGALTGFVVDTSAPVVTGESPAPNSLAPSSPVTVSFTVNKNLNQSTLNANTISVIGAGPDGILGTADDVKVPLTNVNFSVTPLKNGPQGPEQVSFTLPAGLTNDIYQVTLHGAGSPAITDVAGNPLNGSGTPGSDFSWVFVVGNPSAARIVFAGPSSFVSNTAAVQGTRANPFPMINQAIAAAGVGDIVAVLPGTYSENVVLKSLVRVLSASTNSTDSSFQPGNALQTVIRAPTTPPAGATQNITVSAGNLFSVPGLPTELGGVTVISPLVGSQANGTIDPTSIGVNIVNSNVLIDKDFILDGGFGVQVTTLGLNVVTPSIQDDVIAGNTFGVVINDAGTGSVASEISIVNNDIAFNTVGVSAVVGSTAPVLADIGNNIFWQNHDQTAAQNGAAITASTANKLVVQGNLFGPGNGPSGGNPGNITQNVGGGFNPAALGPTPDALGNFTGNPGFVASRDPRPGADGPGVFFQDANFSLTSASAAIDAALPSIAPPVDFLYRSRVRIPGRGFPGTGPADVGAFEFNGTGGIGVGGAFRVASTSLAPGGAALAAGSPTNVQLLGNQVIVNFSWDVNRSSITPSDLVLSGSGLSAANPAHATSLDWIDNHTVAFLLSGSFNSAGTVNVSIPAGSIQSTTNQTIAGFTDSFQVSNTTTSTPTSTSPGSTPTSTSTSTSTSTATTPAPAAGPTSPKHKAKHGIKHPVKHPVKVKPHHNQTQAHKKHPKG